MLKHDYIVTAAQLEASAADVQQDQRKVKIPLLAMVDDGRPLHGGRHKLLGRRL